MTPIESIYEIKNALVELERYLLSKDAIVSKRAQRKYEDLVNRFYKENVNFIAPHQRDACLHDLGYFHILLELAKEHYDTDL